MSKPSDSPQKLDKGKAKAATPVPPRGGRRNGRPGAKAPTGRGGGANAGGAGRRGSAARQSRRRRNRLAALSVVVVVAVVAVVVVVGLTSGGSGKDYTPRSAIPAALAAHIESVAMGDLVAGSAKFVDTNGTSNTLQPVVQLTDAPLSTTKPELLFIGAEFCPICATERWAMVVALSQFGRFSNLHQIRSANRDGDIATVTFYGSTYTSPYLTFAPFEVETNQPSGPTSYKPLQKLTSAQESLWAATEAKVGQNPGFPFLDFNGKYFLYTSQIPDTTLSGLDFTQIANDVGNNDTAIGTDIDASAAALVKYICGMTGEKPASTCTAATNAYAPVSASSSGGATSPAG